MTDDDDQVLADQQMNKDQALAAVWPISLYPSFPYMQVHFFTQICLGLIEKNFQIPAQTASCTTRMSIDSFSSCCAHNII